MQQQQQQQQPIVQGHELLRELDHRIADTRDTLSQLYLELAQLRDVVRQAEERAFNAEISLVRKRVASSLEKSSLLLSRLSEVREQSPQLLQQQQRQQFMLETTEKLLFLLRNKFSNEGGVLVYPNDITIDNCDKNNGPVSDSSIEVDVGLAVSDLKQTIALTKRKLDENKEEWELKERELDEQIRLDQIKLEALESQLQQQQQQLKDEEHNASMLQEQLLRCESHLPDTVLLSSNPD